MSRFYASVETERSTATKCGHKFMNAHIRGWDIGVRVELRIDAAGNDKVTVYKTGGSSGDSFNQRIAQYVHKEDRKK